MKNTAPKDLLFVGIQLVLFVFYFIPLFSISIHLPIFLIYTGLTVSIAGFLITLLAIIQLNKNLTPFPTPINNGRLIQNGLYKFIRHPIYTGILLAALGFGLFSESIWKIALGFCLWILFYFKSKYEENLLIASYSDYEIYKKRTGRFFPFI